MNVISSFWGLPRHEESDQHLKVSMSSHALGVKLKKSMHIPQTFFCRRQLYTGIKSNEIK
jgi:hypothetical protein